MGSKPELYISRQKIKTYICIIFVKPILKFYLLFIIKMFHLKLTPNSLKIIKIYLLETIVETIASEVWPSTDFIN